MCVAHWKHTWLQSQQLGSESRHPAKYCTVTIKLGTEYGTLGSKRGLKKILILIIFIKKMKIQLEYKSYPLGERRMGSKRVTFDGGFLHFCACILNTGEHVFVLSFCWRIYVQWTLSHALYTLQADNITIVFYATRGVSSHNFIDSRKTTILQSELAHNQIWIPGFFLFIDNL